MIHCLYISYIIIHCLYIVYLIQSVTGLCWRANLDNLLSRVVKFKELGVTKESNSSMTFGSLKHVNALKEQIQCFFQCSKSE